MDGVRFQPEPGLKPATEWLIPALWTAYFLVVAVAGVAAKYSPLHLAVLALIYALFSLTLYTAARYLRSLGRPLGALASNSLLIVVTSGLWLHLTLLSREDVTEVPQTPDYGSILPVQAPPS